MLFFRTKNTTLLPFKRFPRICLSGKRVSPFLSSLRRAGMSVEACMAVPLFLFFMVNVLYSFEILRLQGNLTAVLHQAGREMIFNGFSVREMFGDEPAVEAASLLLSTAYAKDRLDRELGKEYLDHTCLAGGSGGIHLGRSKVMSEDDIVDLVADYEVKPFAGLMGFRDFPMQVRVYGRAWTGYDAAGEGEECHGEDPLVYITRTGTVYHTDKDCAYLKPSIRTVSKDEADKARNGSGGKYYPCESCKGIAGSAQVYITEDGSRYHGTLSCPSLKRTVYAIPLSEAGGRGCCVKCGG